MQQNLPTISPESSVHAPFVQAFVSAAFGLSCLAVTYHSSVAGDAGYQVQGTQQTHCDVESDSDEVQSVGFELPYPAGSAEEVQHSLLAHARVQLHQSLGDHHSGLCAWYPLLEDWPQKVIPECSFFGWSLVNACSATMLYSKLYNVLSV